MLRQAQYERKSEIVDCGVNDCTVHVASPLRSYTKNASTVTARGETVNEVLADLEQRFPGMRFRMIDEQGRIREHIRIAINTQMIDDLSLPITSSDTLHLLCALSGG
jgi:molybdopterin converting factor small subunit